MALPRSLIAILALATLTEPGQAGSADDEMLGCMLACLSQTADPDSADYRACSVQNCGPAIADTAEPVWRISRAADGSAHWTWIATAEGRLSVSCKPGGPVIASVEGLGGSPATLRLSVDGRPQPVPVLTRDGVHFCAAMPGSPFLRALADGRVLTASQPGHAITLPLKGSRAALAMLLGRCGLRP